MYERFTDRVVTVPLVGPADGWPRTADGHLLIPGMTVYVDGVCRKIKSLSHNDCGSYIVEYGVEPLYRGDLLMGIRADLTYFIKPVTLESALRDCVNAMILSLDNRSPKNDELAKKAIEESLGVLARCKDGK